MSHSVLCSSLGKLGPYFGISVYTLGSWQLCQGYPICSLCWRDLELLQLGLCLVHARRPSSVRTESLPGAEPCHLLLPNMSESDCLCTRIHHCRTFPDITGVNSHPLRQDQDQDCDPWSQYCILKLLVRRFGLLTWASSSPPVPVSKSASGSCTLLVSVFP